MRTSLSGACRSEPPRQVKKISLAGRGCRARERPAYCPAQLIRHRHLPPLTCHPPPLNLLPPRRATSGGSRFTIARAYSPEFIGNALYGPSSLKGSFGTAYASSCASLVYWQLQASTFQIVSGISAPGKKLVGVAGFEPATPSSRTRCATRLRYTPTEARLIAAVRRGRKHAGRSRVPMANETKTLAEYAASLRFADLPDAVVAARQGLHRRHRRGDRVRRRPALEPDRAALRRTRSARAARAACCSPAARCCARRWPRSPTARWRMPSRWTT